MRDSSMHMPIKGTPYIHQQKAFAFACEVFGLQGGDAPSPIRSRGVALLMEM